jgi:hypothetical protein
MAARPQCAQLPERLSTAGTHANQANASCRKTSAPRDSYTLTSVIGLRCSVCDQRMFAAAAWHCVHNRTNDVQSVSLQTHTQHDYSYIIEPNTDAITVLLIISEH